MNHRTVCHMEPSCATPTIGCTPPGVPVMAKVPAAGAPAPACPQAAGRTQIVSAAMKASERTIFEQPGMISASLRECVFRILFYRKSTCLQGSQGALPAPERPHAESERMKGL